MISLVFIVLNVRDGLESKYPSIVFLSIFVIFACESNLFIRNRQFDIEIEKILLDIDFHYISL